MNIREKAPTLLCIDIQKGFLDEAYWGGGRNNPGAEKVCAELISKWRELELDIIHVRHSSTDPNSKLHENDPGFEFQDLAKPVVGETIITKSVNIALRLWS